MYSVGLQLHWVDVVLYMIIRYMRTSVLLRADVTDIIFLSSLRGVRV